MKGYKCDLCKKWKDGDIPFELSILDRYQDTRDGSPTEEFDICSDCKKWLSSKLQIGK